MSGVCLFSWDDQATDWHAKNCKTCVAVLCPMRPEVGRAVLSPKYRVSCQTAFAVGWLPSPAAVLRGERVWSCPNYEEPSPWLPPLEPDDGERVAA